MALPACMIGDFQMETSEGFNDFMYELGVNFVTRNIANNLYPLQQIRQDPADEMISLGNNNNKKQTNQCNVFNSAANRLIGAVVQSRRRPLAS